MNNSEKPSGCPFHTKIILAAKHEGAGLPYKNLASKVEAHGLDPVLSSLEAVPQRALTAYYVSQIFWSVFEENHTVDHAWLSHHLKIDPDRYHVFAEEAKLLVFKALKKMATQVPVDLSTLQKEAHAKLTEIVKIESTKGTRYPSPEDHINSEIDGAISLLIHISELIDRLYQKDFPNSGGPIPGELFLKILRSPEFSQLTQRLANGSEALISYIHKNIGLHPCINLDNFYLNHESGKDYPVLHIKEGVLEKLIQQFEAEETPAEPKVRCHAADIKVKSLYSGENVSMVKATLEWLVEEVMAPHL